jgi:hypothetical protein
MSGAAAVAAAGAEPAQIPLHMLIGVHHKTGSKWMLSVLDPLYGALKKRGFPHDLYFSYHSKFSDDLLSLDFRGFHLIRDPRDVVISGMHHHMKASDEVWLQLKQNRFDGLTYQQKILSLPTERDQFLFELEQRGKLTIFGMTSWNYKDPRFFEARYEDLINDVDGRMFGDVLRFLLLPDDLVEAGVLRFKQQTLFPNRAVPTNHPHIRSGKAEQWRNYFHRWHGERFVEVTGDALITLGYEPNHDWVTRLPE